MTTQRSKPVHYAGEWDSSALAADLPDDVGLLIERHAMRFANTGVPKFSRRIDDLFALLNERLRNGRPFVDKPNRH